MTFCRNCGSSLPCTCAASYGPSREEIEYEREKREKEHRTYVPAPPKHEVLRKKAWQKHLDGKDSEALELINQSIDIKRDIAESWNIKGIILEEISFGYDPTRYVDAVFCYDRALYLNPQNSVIKNNKAVCLNKWAYHLYSRKSYDLAMEKIDEALPLFERKEYEYAETLFYKGKICDERNEILKALIYYDEAEKYGYHIYGLEGARYGIFFQIWNKNTYEEEKDLKIFKSDDEHNPKCVAREADLIYQSAMKIYDSSRDLEMALDITEAGLNLTGGEERFTHLKDKINARIAENENNEGLMKSIGGEKLITITGTRYYDCPKLEKGMIFKLKKEPENINDKDAIGVYLEGNKIGYIANSIHTADDLTSKASDIQDIDEDTGAEYLFMHSEFHIAKLI